MDIAEQQQINKIVLEVGHRLSDPNVVKKVLEREQNKISMNGQSVSGLRKFLDYPALCILFGELDGHFPEGKWDQVAHQYMLILQEVINREPLGGTALVGGAPGLGMAGMALARDGTRYSKFITAMNEFVLTSCERRLPEMQEKLGGEVSMEDYDAISGFSGTLRYLLFFKDQPREKKIIIDVLSYFVALTADIEVNGHKVPGWYISAEQQFLPSDKEKYPQGNFNIGMAHGISGVLAVLAIAFLYKIEVPGQKMAIYKIIKWLCQFQIKVPDRVGVFWPSHVSWEEQIKGKLINSTYDRDGWCYGTPGVARAIYLAGCALQDQKLKELSIQAFDAVFAKAEVKWRLPAPTFCHGLAGLLYLTQLMYMDTGLSQFYIYRQQVLTCLLKKYQPDKPFAFQELEWQENELEALDRVGLINGAAGSALSLLSLVKPINSNWDAMFLLR